MADEQSGGNSSGSATQTGVGNTITLTQAQLAFILAAFAGAGTLSVGAASGVSAAVATQQQATQGETDSGSTFRNVGIYNPLVPVLERDKHAREMDQVAMQMLTSMVINVDMAMKKCLGLNVPAETAPPKSGA